MLSSRRPLDCLVEPGSIDRLARLVRSFRRPVQGTYLNEIAPPHRAKSASMVAFAWKSAGFPCGRWDGTGFQLPCHCLEAGWRSPWNWFVPPILAAVICGDPENSGLGSGAGPENLPAVLPEAVVTSDVERAADPIVRRQRGALGARHRSSTIPGNIIRGLLIRLVPDAKLASFWRSRLTQQSRRLHFLPGTWLYLAVASAFAGDFFNGAGHWRLPAMNCILPGGMPSFSPVAHGQNLLPLRWLPFAPI